jgi:hypothetical protein
MLTRCRWCWGRTAKCQDRLPFLYRFLWWKIMHLQCNSGYRMQRWDRLHHQHIFHGFRLGQALGSWKRRGFSFGGFERLNKIWWTVLLDLSRLGLLRRCLQIILNRVRMWIFCLRLLRWRLLDFILCLVMWIVFRVLQKMLGSWHLGL